MTSPAFSSDAQAASGADQRARILVAAEAVIRERGLNQTRLRDVAAAAGVSTGMVQHYFDSRDRLLAEAFQYNNRRRAEAWGHAAVSSADAWGKIESLITHALDPRRLAERSAVYVDFCSASLRDPELRRSMDESYNEWRAPTRRAIQQGIDDGSFTTTASVDDLVDSLAMTLDGQRSRPCCRSRTWSQHGCGD